jgi:hypothetical protein
MLDASDLKLFERILDASWSALSVEESRPIAELAFPPADLRRIDLLGKRAQTGSLTPKEREDLDRYVTIGRFLTYLKARARLAARGAKPAASGRKAS